MHNWLQSLAAAAFIGGITGALAPEGRGRKLVSLIAGFMTIAVLLSPISEIDVSGFSGYAASYGEEFAIPENTLQTVISEEYRAYILSKAPNTVILGFTLDENNLPYDISYSGEDISELLTNELRIPKERQNRQEETND
ncbi:MAG: hypothetical protein LBN97_01655 [Oscillospiraceae bacterium]|jgi:hypothetical protein|nr:hypothetical protein [Oscillospiraceae bacterium]